MGLIKYIKNKFETRNYAISNARVSTLPKPIYTEWTVANSVKYGYSKNPWVYRSVYLKSKAGSTVPWRVENSEGEVLKEHHLTKLLEMPNPWISRQDLFELLILWLELAGNTYLKKVSVKSKSGMESSNSSQQTRELWPISPDRLHPIPSSNPEEWMAGYALDKAKIVTYTQDELVHVKYFNPENPLLGLPPLASIGQTIDLENSMKDFNVAATQNRGVIDGIFTFERNFRDQDEANTVRDKLNESYRGKRSFGVLGGNAKFIRTALSPAELDFSDGMKASREEIFTAFGVPSIYAGVSDATTYNNYQTSELIFWFGTMMFLLDDIADTLNFSFKNELKENERITYDIMNIPAIRSALYDKVKTAKELYAMGVPFEQLNRIFKFSVNEFEDWDKSKPSEINQQGEFRSEFNGSVKKKF